ncbi:Oidioi.mRNA.OKI2018_I69.PAR.g9986.t1.cds [Oikopleura dioica]|uniref:Oidioi.mRNA.OKI2018_I69.PAR.g9986.t1.cds n=1 Tax=Oikopleura dioica TaxID=34765 RepID=A0ABN7RRB1_OIKDI|nr:Oidioi.mRNA.OKI2018_I69.PAR.g9986.t1.cds [Oikopleura dioica]
MDLLKNERANSEKELSLELKNLELLIHECKKFMQPVETAIDAIRATLSEERKANLSNEELRIMINEKIKKDRMEVQTFIFDPNTTLSLISKYMDAEEDELKVSSSIEIDYLHGDEDQSHAEDDKSVVDSAEKQQNQSLPEVPKEDKQKRRRRQRGKKTKDGNQAVKKIEEGMENLSLHPKNTKENQNTSKSQITEKKPRKRRPRNRTRSDICSHNMILYKKNDSNYIDHFLARINSCGHQFGGSCLEMLCVDRQCGYCPKCKRPFTMEDIKPVH